MRKIKLIALVAGALMLAAPVANAVPNYVGTWYACAIHGQLSDPDYLMRLDGFFDGDGSHEPTFAGVSAYSVEFQANADGTARLWGTIEVVELNGSSGASVGDVWNLDVSFVTETNTADIVGYNSGWDYYNIDPNAGNELVNASDNTDYANLWTYPAPGSTDLKPFRVGNGGNGKNSNFGAAGWLSYEHGAYGSQGQYVQASDFLMDLKPVPEPGTMLLVGLGLAGGGARFIRRRKKS